MKVSFNVEDYWPGSVAPSATPVALVFPAPRDEDLPEVSKIVPISSADGLRRLIELNWPVRLPWGFDGFLDMMRDLAEDTPCYRQEYGVDIQDLPERVAELLNE